MPVDWKLCQENCERRQAEALRQREVQRQKAREMVLTAIAQLAPAYPLVERVYLFGSVTQADRFHTNSDIDVAVEGTDAETYFAFWRDLERICFNWMIDLREINTPSHFTETIKQQGELVYERPDLAA